MRRFATCIPLPAPRYRWMLLAVTSLLSACGGGGAPKILTGSFNGGSVVGVRYATATQRGLTGARGTFNYIEGESVTFSIGGTTLGSATGASNISPLDFLQVPPPTTERGLRAELNQLNTVTGFMRACNVATLLLTLDADGNPGNGINLLGRDSALAAVTLNLDTRVFDFPERLRHLGVPVNRNIPLSRSLIYLYETAGISLVAHAVTRRESVDAQGQLGSQEDTEYDAGGRIASQRIEEPQEVRRGLFTYDGLGRVLTSRWDYEDRGNPLGNSALALTNSYDPLGNRVSWDIDWYRVIDGVPESHWSHETWVATFDVIGNQLAATGDWDLFGDGTTESRTAQSFSYDGRGNMLAETSRYEDYREPLTHWLERHSYSYDQSDRMTSDSFDFDEGSDGDSDSFGSTTFTYDDSGNLLERSWKTQDLRWQAPWEGGLVSISYDGHRNALTHTSVSYRGDLPSPQPHSDWVSTYDDSSRLLTRMGGETTYSFTYDSTGNLLTRVLEVPYSPSKAGYRQSTQYEYGSYGNLLTGYTETRGVRFVGWDLVPIYQEYFDTSHTQLTFTAISNGVAYLAVLYFDNILTVEGSVCSIPGEVAITNQPC